MEFSNTVNNPSMNIYNADLITSEQGILNALIESKEKGSMIGIQSPVLGGGTFITGVVDILFTDYGIKVVTKGYDVNGYFLNKSTLDLNEIKSVIPFISIFKNPFMKVDAE